MPIYLEHSPECSRAAVGWADVYRRHEKAPLLWYSKPHELKLFLFNAHHLFGLGKNITLPYTLLLWLILGERIRIIFLYIKKLWFLNFAA